MTTNLYFVRHAHSVYSPDEYKRPLPGDRSGDHGGFQGKSLGGSADRSF